MRLDKLVDKIANGEGDSRRPKSDYKPKYLVDIVETLQELDGLNTMTKDGLKKYKDITGQKPDKKSIEEIELDKKSGYIAWTEDISNYFQKHIKKYVKDLSEDARINLALQYCPERKAKNVKDSYNKTAETIRDAKKELKEIQEDPDKYLKEKLKKETRSWRHAVMRFKDEYLKISVGCVQKKAIDAIRNYERKNKESFLITTKKHMEKQNEKFRKKEEEFGKYCTQLQEKNLPAKAFEKEIRKKYKKLGKNFEEYQDGALLKKLIRSIATTSIVELREKMGRKPIKPEEIELGKVFGDTFNIDTDIIKGKKYNDKRK